MRVRMKKKWRMRWKRSRILLFYVESVIIGIHYPFYFYVLVSIQKLRLKLSRAVYTGGDVNQNATFIHS